MLRDEDLARLEAAWRTQQAPITGKLLPGLTDARREELEAAHDVVLPAELRRWWGWHDGVQGGGRRGGPDSAIGAPWNFLSLQEALDVRRFQVERNPGSFPQSEELWDGDWAPWWLPVFKAGSAHFFADLSASTDGGVPMHLWAQQPDPPFTAVFASLGEMIRCCATGIERRHFTWSSDLKEWDISDYISADGMRLL